MRRFFKEDSFHGSPDETKLDKLLLIFERIATVYEMGALSDEDLDFMAYEFIRINDNRSVQAYFTWLDKWYKTRGIGEKSFAALRRTAIKLEKRHMAVKALDAEVEDVTSKGDHVRSGGGTWNIHVVLAPLIHEGRTAGHTDAEASISTGEDMLVLGFCDDQRRGVSEEGAQFI